MFLIEFQSIPNHSNPFHSIPCFTQCLVLAQTWFSTVNEMSLDARKPVYMVFDGLKKSEIPLFWHRPGLGTDLVGNPEDWFSHDAAQLMKSTEKATITRSCILTDFGSYLCSYSA